MWPLLFALLLQFYSNRPVLQAEDARAAQPTAILEALNSTEPLLQRQAVRAVGRLERPQLADAIRPLLASSDSGIRMETVNALGQMNVTFDAPSLLDSEKDAAVRAV